MIYNYFHSYLFFFIKCLPFSISHYNSLWQTKYFSFGLKTKFTNFPQSKHTKFPKLKYNVIFYTLTKFKLKFPGFSLTWRKFSLTCPWPVATLELGLGQLGLVVAGQLYQNAMGWGQPRLGLAWHGSEVHHLTWPTRLHEGHTGNPSKDFLTDAFISWHAEIFKWAF